MSQTKRYLISRRFGQELAPSAEETLRSFIAQQRGREEIRSTPKRRRVVAMTEWQMQDLARQLPELLIEEDLPLQLFDMAWLPFSVPSEETCVLTVEVRDGIDNKPIPGVTLVGYGRSGFDYVARTDKEGRAMLQTSERLLTRLIAFPRDSYWSRVIPDIDIEADRTVVVTLKRLLITGAYDWGHRLMGFRAVNQRFSGNGVKIAVIDSGVTDKSEDFTPAGGYNTLAGQDPNTWNVDERGHGTHVAGIVAALNNAVGVVGGAPKAKVFSLKVFPGGYISDMVEAIEWCIQNQMDVVNLGLGTRGWSLALAEVVYDAYLHGITCVAAAGNDRSPVAYPAALPTTIAVNAVGRFGTFPEDSAHVLSVSSSLDWYGGLFAANFCNLGRWIDVCAPGVAILSTVPTGYAAWDGTSMACPAISALVALILEAYPTIRTGDAQQVEYVRQILYSAAVNLGMPPGVQGRGLPLAGYALGLHFMHSPGTSG